MGKFVVKGLSEVKQRQRDGNVAPFSGSLESSQHKFCGEGERRAEVEIAIRLNIELIPVTEAKIGDVREGLNPNPFLTNLDSCTKTYRNL